MVNFNNIFLKCITYPYLAHFIYYSLYTLFSSSLHQIDNAVSSSFSNNAHDWHKKLYQTYYYHALLSEHLVWGPLVAMEAYANTYIAY